MKVCGRAKRINGGLRRGEEKIRRDSMEKEKWIKKQGKNIKEERQRNGIGSQGERQRA